MGKRSKQEYLGAILKRYQLGDKKEKQAILDEFCRVCEYNRKYAIRLLSRGDIKVEHRTNRPAGRHRKYDDPAILDTLKYIWEKLNLPCSKRFKAGLPLWLPHYEHHRHIPLTLQQRLLLSSIFGCHHRSSDGFYASQDT